MEMPFYGRVRPYLSVLLLFSFAVLFRPVHCACNVTEQENRNSGDCRSTETVDGLEVDCSGRSLEHVPPSLPINTGVLLLNRNRIQTLRNIDFKGCRSLVRLAVSSNALSKIEEQAFEDTENLAELDLVENLLSFERNSFPENAFRPLRKLTDLRMQRNNWKNSTEYPTWIFGELANLRTLTIDGLPNVTFDGNFSLLAGLKSLSVYGGLNAVTNETLIGLGGCPIEYLNITTEDGSLTRLEPLSFAALHRLKTLDLGFNRGLGFKAASDSFYGLQFTNITELVLSRIIADDSVANEFIKEYYTYLNLSRNIKKFLVDKNNIVSVEMGLATNLPNLEHFDISYNRISNVETLILDVAATKRIRFVDSSHQSKRYIRKRKDVTAEEEEEKREDPGNRTSERCPTPPLLPCQIPWPFGKIDSFVRDGGGGGALGATPLSDHGPWCLPLSPRLETLNLSSSLNVDLQTLPQMIILGGHHLRNFVYQNNGVRVFAGPVIITRPNQSVPVTFDFSGNGMTCLAADFLKYSVQLGFRMGCFILNSNNLGDQLERETDGDVFRWYRNLTELHLAQNNIRILPKNVFVQLPELRVLNLSGNSLGQIQFRFDHLRNLRVLDLSGNLLTNLDDDVLEQLYRLHLTSNLSVNLFGNPIQCSCDSVSFLHFIQDKRPMFADVADYSCLYREHFVKFDRLRVYLLNDLDYRCSSQLLLIVVAVVFVVSILIVAVSILLYRHRWDVRFFCLRLTTQRKKAQTPEAPKTFDAFVIYGNDDRAWIFDELLRNLEREQEPRVPAQEREQRPHRKPQNDFNLDDAAELLTAVDFEGCDAEPGAAAAGGGGRELEPLKLCVHERDFPAGESIWENIVRSIDDSRKILIVLSDSFAQSEWCGYELELAKIASVDRGRNLLVPILLGRLETRTLSKNLQSLLRQYTYIDWNDHRANPEEFWDKLRQALARPSCMYVCECGRSMLENQNA